MNRNINTDQNPDSRTRYSIEFHDYFIRNGDIQLIIYHTWIKRRYQEIFQLRTNIIWEKNYFFMSYKKGILNNSYLASLPNLASFRFFSFMNFIVHRIVMPLLSYRRAFVNNSRINILCKLFCTYHVLPSLSVSFMFSEKS